MNFQDMYSAIRDAENVLQNADEHSTRIARLLVGRLRKVNSRDVLKSLKKELDQLDARSGQWKDQQRGLSDERITVIRNRKRQGNSAVKD